MYSRYLKNFDSKRIQTVNVDYLVVGGGIAGLFTAWSLHKQGLAVTVLTKQGIDNSNTYKAQGGIAAAIGSSDSIDKHFADTLIAGAGLCNGDAVKILVSEGCERIKELIKLGVNFDRVGNDIALGREGCHSEARILHADGDATGREVIRAIRQKVADIPEIKIMEYQQLVDLLLADNICYGALVFDCRSRKFQVFKAKAIILATGGIGQLYGHTTNPEVATADGIAAAYRAGAEVMDMEFVQFHPTALAIEGAPCFLISEAVRGEGAILRNKDKQRFMPKYHSMAELAPRDVVTRAIIKEMNNSEANYVYLDITHMPAEKIRERFPTITATCQKYGLDITKELLPIAPAAHYMMGGVKINLWGETSIEGLFCCGESACLGVHGANRLASNSLLEGLVMGDRIARRVTSIGGNKISNIDVYNKELKAGHPFDYDKLAIELKHIMDTKVGPLRNAIGLKEAIAWFDKCRDLNYFQVENYRDIEVRNMLTVGRLIAEAAILRTESRGGHFRQDYPEVKENWCKHVLLKR